MCKRLPPLSLIWNGFWWHSAPGIKWLGSQFDYSPPSGGENKNDGAVGPLPPIMILKFVNYRDSIYPHRMNVTCGQNQISSFTTNTEFVLEGL
jgi:hypothetical protein